MDKEFVLTPVDVMKELLEKPKISESPLGMVALRLAKAGFDKSMPVSTKVSFADPPSNKDYLISDPDTGGAFQEISYWRELVTLLRDKSVIRPNAQILPVPTGKLLIRRQTAGTTAYWVGEGMNITKSSGTYETIYLIPKKLAAIAVFSNDVLRYTGNLMASVVQNDLIETIAETEDRTFILSAGDTNVPKGLYGYAADTNKLDYDDYDDEVKAIEAMLGKLAAGKSFKKPIWLMNPKSKIHLQFLQNTNGAFVFPELQQNLLVGYPVFETTQIPFSGTPPKTTIFLVDASEMVIGQGVTMTLEFFPNGAYYDGTGVVSGISADESVYRVIEEVDFFIRHTTSVVVLENVPW